jgi:hypothetical protein
LPRGKARQTGRRPKEISRLFLSAALHNPPASPNRGTQVRTETLREKQKRFEEKMKPFA